MRTTMFLVLLGVLMTVSVSVAVEPPIVLGIYPTGHCRDAGVSYLQTIDAWLGPTNPRITICGDFMAANVTWDVQLILDATWDAGYVPFFNLAPYDPDPDKIIGTIEHVNQQWFDTYFKDFAKEVGKFLAKQGGRRVYIAPLQENNGNWVPWYTPGSNAGAFKAAWAHIRSLMDPEFPPGTVRWVFAPNGSSAAGDGFEQYYPGHSAVDIIALSAFNHFGCNPEDGNLDYATAVGQYVNRIQAMAPGKPIFLAQTGANANPGYDKSEWLRVMVNLAAQQPSLRGMIFFSTVNPATCDYRVHIPGTSDIAGFKTGVQQVGGAIAYGRDPATTLLNTMFATQLAHLFDDVHPFHPWAVDDSLWNYEPWVRALVNAGITGGCSTSPPLYCPEDSVPRKYMAIFLLRGIHGAGYAPPPGTGTMFADVPLSHPQVAWIERLAREGIAGGCSTSPLLYCPQNDVLRNQMAIFLVRTFNLPM